MKDIYRLIEEKRQEVERLKRELDALIIAANLLGKEEKPPLEGGKVSVPQMLVAILDAAGKPLHVKEIEHRLKQKFDTAIKRSTMTVLLYRYAQRARHFYKVIGKPNTYGLLKWKALQLETKEEKTA